MVAKPDADQNRISSTICSMPDYFTDYYTTVNFISQEELNANHKKLSHGGLVIRGENTTKENAHKLELSVKLDSNPEFTASIMLTYVRACHRLFEENKIGALTPLDIAPMYLLEEQYKHNLIKFL